MVPSLSLNLTACFSLCAGFTSSNNLFLYSFSFDLTCWLHVVRHRLCSLLTHHDLSTPTLYRGLPPSLKKGRIR